jgi:hypothetical protein
MNGAAAVLDKARKHVRRIQIPHPTESRSSERLDVECGGAAAP